MKHNDIEYTSVDDLIEQLEKLKSKGLGDYPVCINGISPVSTSTRPYYYDGGYLVRDATKSNRDFLRSRIRDENGKSLGMRDGVKDMCVDITSLDLPYSAKATIDGRTVRDMEPETWSFMDNEEQEEMAIFGGIVRYRLATKRNAKLGCHPFTAYLDSGESAIGPSMNNAKAELKKQFSKENKNHE